MSEKKINPRVRLVIIKKGKILLSYTNDEKFYFYIGGKVEYGETLIQACQREIEEECGANTKFTFQKILYVRDYIKPEENEHSLELYILGNIDKFEEIEGVKDKEFNGNHWQTWVDLDKLPKLDIRPKNLTNQLIADYQNSFSGKTKYLEEMGTPKGIEKRRLVCFFPILGIPLIQKGDDLGLEIYKATKRSEFFFQENDIIVIAQKIVSKAEGRTIPFNSVVPSGEAQELSQKSGKPAELCQVILEEAEKVIKVEPGIIVTEHHLGYIGSSAGVDRSNTGSSTGEIALLLPADPDKSARRIRKKIKSLLNINLAVIISDSGGRSDRLGSRGEAIGVAGIPSLLVDDRKDLFGRPLHTEIALIDSVAATASLVMGESNEKCPVVVVRGVKYPVDEKASIQTILKRGDSALQ